MTNLTQNKLLLWFSLFLWATVSFSQRSIGGFPLSDDFDGKSSLKSAAIDEWVEMPPFDVDMLRKDSVQTRVGGFQFAHAFDTDIHPGNSGTIHRLADGTKVWRVKIRSANALNVNLIFSRFRLEGDAKLFLYSPDKKEILGAYTAANNQASGVLATTPITNDEIVVEYIEPEGAKGDIAIGKVCHGFRDFRALPEYGKSKECEVDVSCSDMSSPTRRSVALMLVEGVTLCSGTLINNTAEDGTPYFLTADHCFETDSATENELKKLAATCIFYFNYETPHCMENVLGSLEFSLSGAELISHITSNDMLLLKLNETPPLEYSTYYAGWNTSKTISTNVYTFHHPQGDVKKYSLSKSAPETGTFYFDNINFSSNVHWLVDGWQIGLTEAGSSGSPLFDSEDRVIGALTGGYDPSGCGKRNLDAFYRLNAAWTSRMNKNTLSSHLDPLGTRRFSLHGREPYPVHCTRISNFDANDLLHVSTPNNYVAGSNEHGIIEYAEKFHTETPGKIYGVYFIPEKGSYYDKDTIWLKIYSGTNHPDSLLHRQRIRISDTQYSPRVGFNEKTWLALSSRDNYLHLNTPIEVDTTFFVSVEIPQNPTYAFGIYATEEKSQNTAFFKENEEWKPFTEHPILHAPTSLLIDPFLADETTSHTSDATSDDEQTILYPNPVQDELHLHFVEQPIHLTVFSLNGISFYNQNISCNDLTVDLSIYPQGVYFAKIVFDNHIEIIKFIKR